MVDMSSLCLQGKAQDCFCSLRSRGVADFVIVKHQLIVKLGKNDMRLMARPETRSKAPQKVSVIILTI